MSGRPPTAQSQGSVAPERSFGRFRRPPEAPANTDPYTRPRNKHHMLEFIRHGKSCRVSWQ